MLLHTYIHTYIGYMSLLELVITQANTITIEYDYMVY